MPHLLYEPPLLQRCPHRAFHSTAAASTVGEALPAGLQLEEVLKKVDCHSCAAEQECQEDIAVLRGSRMTWTSSLAFYLERERFWTLMWCLMQPLPESF